MSVQHIAAAARLLLCSYVFFVHRINISTPEPKRDNAVVMILLSVSAHI
jgi:hypothetical protein